MSTSLRPRVRDLVELCVYVRDSQAAASEARESLRKIKWKRAKQSSSASQSCSNRLSDTTRAVVVT